MNSIGTWDWDDAGLPTYDYTGGFPFHAKDKLGRDAGMSDDPCFILGNYRLTLFVHASGMVQFITGERGWARLNHGGKNRGWNRTMLSVASGGVAAVTQVLAGGDVRAEPNSEQTYGVGYSRSVFHLQNGLTVTRVLAVKPSAHLHEGNPCFLIAATLTNHGPDAVSARYREEVLANYVMMNDQDASPADQRVEYIPRSKVDPARGLATTDFSFRSVKLLVPPECPDDAYTHDIAPPLLFLKAESTVGATTTVETRSDGVGEILSGETEVTLEPGESRTVRFVIGLSFARDDASIDAQITELLAEAEVRDGAGPFSSQWRKLLPNFDGEQDPILRREMTWNTYTLEAMATYSQYFRETFIPQGSVYAYHLGQSASNRDHLQHALPMMFTNPSLAKSCIRHAMKHSLHDGEIKRQTIGFGYSDPGIYMESDPQLYMFMAVAEYLRITGDHAFLNETVDYYPMEMRRSEKVLTLLTKHFIYLRDTVGTGKHGLVKMLNSDWSDSFFHRHSPNIYRLFAESHMNSTMALAVLPPFIRELKRASQHLPNPTLADDLIGGLNAYHDALHVAVMQDMEGRTFAPRCYLGEHDEPELKFGMDHLCLEAQPFLLQIEEFPFERKRRLFHEIRTRVLDMEKSGARTREVPIWDREGRGEDGGIWWAHQGPLLVGVATFDREAALRLLRRFTFHVIAENYPDYWLGHWTSADSFESTLSNREGLYHSWTDRAFQPFCAHSHAWMLYSYFRIRELQGVQTAINELTNRPLDC